MQDQDVRVVWNERQGWNVCERGKGREGNAKRVISLPVGSV